MYNKKKKRGIEKCTEYSSRYAALQKYVSKTRP